MFEEVIESMPSLLIPRHGERYTEKNPVLHHELETLMFDDFTDLAILHHLLTDTDIQFERFIAKQLIGA